MQKFAEGESVEKEEERSTESWVISVQDRASYGTLVYSIELV
jgi:hypothetical protein